MGTTAEAYPSPSCPVSLRPQPYARPAESMATEWQEVGDVATNAILDLAKREGKRRVGERSSWDCEVLEMADLPGLNRGKKKACVRCVCEQK